MSNNSKSTRNVNGNSEKLYTSAELRSIIYDLLSDESWFRFYHCFLEVMSKAESLFIQELINISTLSNTKKEVNEKGELFFMCTSEFLLSSKLKPTLKEQKTLFASLKRKNYIKIERRDVLGLRWIHIPIDLIFTEIRDKRQQQINQNENDRIVPKRTKQIVPKGTKSFVPKGTIKKEEDPIRSSSLNKRKEKNRCSQARNRDFDTGFINKNEPNEFSSQITELTTKLINILRYHRKITREPNFKKDVMRITTLINNKFTTINELKLILEWYNSSIKIKYVPKAHSVEQFITKFGSILDKFKELNPELYCDNSSNSIEDIYGEDSPSCSSSKLDWG